jgi:hypothetical protein
VPATVCALAEVAALVASAMNPVRATAERATEIDFRKAIKATPKFR